MSRDKRHGLSRVVREGACGSDFDNLLSITEMDEAYWGGKEADNHAIKKFKAGRGAVCKVSVIAGHERVGPVVAMLVEKADPETAAGFSAGILDEGSPVFTNQSTFCNKLPFEHNSVSYGEGEYVRDDVLTNGMEIVWAVLKGSIHGTWHHFSLKHFHCHVNEAAMRLNTGRCQRHTPKRIVSFDENVFWYRITYWQLIS